MTPGARAWLVAVVAMAVAGCATRPPERIPYNAEARRDVLRIVILEPAPPNSLLVSSGLTDVMVGVAGAGGLGGLVMIPVVLAAAAVEATMSKSFSQAAVDAGFDPGDTLTASLASELERLGFRVARHRVARAAVVVSTEPRWIGDYRPWRDSADAVLDVQWLTVGFRSRDPTLPYLPLANVGVRLVEPRDHRILYRETVSFGFGLMNDGWGQYGGDPPTALLADDKRRFDDFAALVARKDEAFDALRGAARGVAARIAFDLAPP